MFLARVVPKMFSSLVLCVLSKHVCCVCGDFLCDCPESCLKWSSIGISQVNTRFSRILYRKYLRALVAEDLKQEMMIWESTECGTSAPRRGNRVVGHPLLGDLQSSPNLLNEEHVLDQ